MSSIFRAITQYLRLGIDEHTAPDEARRIQLLNTMGLVMFLACLPYIPLFYALGLTALAIAVVPISLIDLAIPLISRKSPNAARVVYFTNLACAVFTYSDFLGREAGIQLLYFAGAVIPVLVTSLRQRWVIAYGIATVCLAYGTLLYFDFHTFGPPQLAADMRPYVYAPMVYTTLAVVVVCMVYFAALNDQANRRLDKRNGELQLVLDSIAQGIVALDREGKISEERSMQADRWLGSAEAGTPFAEILVKHAPDDALAWELGWEALLEDFLPIELALDQMPSRVEIDGTPVRIECTPLFERGDAEPWTRLMLMLTDVSAELEAERAERSAREDMALFQAASRDRDGVRRFVEETDRLVAVLTEPDTRAINEKRTLHTLKGNCGLFGLELVAEVAHRLEDEIESMGEGLRTEQRDELSTAWADTRARIAPFVFTEQAQGCVVLEDELDEVVSELLVAQPAVARRISSWRHTPGATVLGRLGDQASSLMQRLSGRDLRVVIDADDVRIDEDRTQRVFAAMSHVVRNAVDHGLGGIGDDREPTLTLGASCEGDDLVITVADNGQGIDWDRLWSKAERMGLPADTQEDLQAALFADGISTRDEITDISGRGVGMSAVRSEVEALGGSITVNSRRGEGTEFRFALPLSEPSPTLRVAR